MTRRAAFQIGLLGVMAATVVVLGLNLLEKDRYPSGLDPRAEAGPGELPPWIPPVLLHPCVWCELCLHRFELAESRIAVTVADRDGWYRIFWAGTDTYVYDDPAVLGVALRNRTAEIAEGTWTLRGRYAPMERAESHPCPAAAGAVDARYALRRGSYPGSGVPAADPSGTLLLPRRFMWIQYPFLGAGDRDLWWELENPETFAGASKIPCSCGQPVPGKK